MSSALTRSISTGQPPALVCRNGRIEGYHTLFSSFVTQCQQGEAPTKARRVYPSRGPGALLAYLSKGSNPSAVQLPPSRSIVKSLHKRNTFSIQHYSSDYTDSCFAILSHRQFPYTVKNSIVVSSLPKAVYTACAITIRLTQR